MSTAFSFFLRLFLCFVAARFILQAIGVEGRGYLVGLTIVFLINVYWFSYLVFRDRTASPTETGSPHRHGEVNPPPGERDAPEKQAPPEA
ncbi:MAG: hypothetical protein ACOZFS_09055 [Thermodesulfobacteriota bacterium]